MEQTPIKSARRPALPKLRVGALRALRVNPHDRRDLQRVIETGEAAAPNGQAPQQVVAPEPEPKAKAPAEKKQRATEIVIKLPGGEKRNCGKQHRSFPVLLQLLAARQHVYLVGPAGSGKTTAADECAKALGLDFYCQSVGAQTTQAQLIGYSDATGSYVPTHFRRAYENGGVFLLDEIDAGNANVLTVLNAALANGQCAFPDKMVTRHENFRCIAAANTFGTGADRQYVGRNQLDAASIDRFAFLDWPYDEALEAELADNDDWTAHVVKARRAVELLKVRHVVSPRASIKGAQLLSAGIAREQVEASLLWKGLDTETRAKVEAQMRMIG